MVEGLEFPVSICPYSSKGCEWVGTYRCTTECQHHPENYMLDEETRKEFEESPWKIYCLTCGQFITTRWGHPEAHVVATGFNEFKEKVPEFVMERLAGRDQETGDMNW